MSQRVEYVVLERESAVARIRLCRPDKLNSLCPPMHLQLQAVLRECAKLAEAGEVRAVILTGDGRAFCTGQDLNERRRRPGEAPPDLGRSVRENLNPAVLGLASLPVPVVAA